MPCYNRLTFRHPTRGILTYPQRLFNRDYALLLSGSVVSTFGSSVYLIAFVLLLKEMTQSAVALNGEVGLYTERTHAAYHTQERS